MPENQSPGKLASEGINMVLAHMITLSIVRFEHYNRAEVPSSTVLERSGEAASQSNFDIEMHPSHSAIPRMEQYFDEDSTYVPDSRHVLQSLVYSTFISNQTQTVVFLIMSESYPHCLRFCTC